MDQTTLSAIHVVVILPGIVAFNAAGMESLPSDKFVGVNIHSLRHTTKIDER